MSDSEEHTLHGEKVTTEPSTQSSSTGLWVAVIVVGFVLLVAIYGVVGLYAWQTGQKEAAEMQLTDRANIVLEQIQYAQQDIKDENFQLALGRLDAVLEIVPENAVAITLKQQAEQGIAARSVIATPIIFNSQPTPLPTLAIVESNEANGTDNAGQASFNALRDQLNNADYEGRISLLLTHQTRHPSYQRAQIDQWLYEAYSNYARQLLYSPQVELGIFYSERALELGPLSAELVDLRYFGQQYLNGRAYYGINWTVTIPYFRELCASVPGYQNSCGVLLESLIAYGDQVALAGDPCLASGNYQEAVSYGATGLDSKIWNANEQCAATGWNSATPGAWPTVTPIN